MWLWMSINGSLRRSIFPEKWFETIALVATSCTWKLKISIHLIFVWAGGVMYLIQQTQTRQRYCHVSLLELISITFESLKWVRLRSLWVTQTNASQPRRASALPHHLYARHLASIFKFNILLNKHPLYLWKLLDRSQKRNLCQSNRTCTNPTKIDENADIAAQQKYWHVGAKTDTKVRLNELNPSTPSATRSWTWPQNQNTSTHHPNNHGPPSWHSRRTGQDERWVFCSM